MPSFESAFLTRGSRVTLFNGGGELFFSQVILYTLLVVITGINMQLQTGFDKIETSTS